MMDVKSILLVDDEPEIVDELQEALEFEGFDVSTAYSVDTAMSMLDKAPVDLIVTDLKMPGLGGLDLLRSVRDHSVSPVVIVVSGHGAESNRTEAMSLGALQCFAKPLDVDALVEFIQEAG